MNSDNASELFPIVDNDGRTIGSATRGECHSGSMLLHPVVHLHLFNSSGDLYLQRRPDWKDIQPGKWDTAVGGTEASAFDAHDGGRFWSRSEIGNAIGQGIFTPNFENEYRTVVLPYLND